MVRESCFDKRTLAEQDRRFFLIRTYAIGPFYRSPHETPLGHSPLSEKERGN